VNAKWGPNCSAAVFFGYLILVGLCEFLVGWFHIRCCGLDVIFDTIWRNIEHIWSHFPCTSIRHSDHVEWSDFRRDYICITLYQKYPCTLLKTVSKMDDQCEAAESVRFDFLVFYKSNIKQIWVYFTVLPFQSLFLGKFIFIQFIWN